MTLVSSVDWGCSWLGSLFVSLALSCVWALFRLKVAAESLDVRGPSHWFFGGDMYFAEVMG